MIDRSCCTSRPRRWWAPGLACAVGLLLFTCSGALAASAAGPDRSAHTHDAGPTSQTPATTGTTTPDTGGAAAGADTSTTAPATRSAPATGVATTTGSTTVPGATTAPAATTPTTTYIPPTATPTTGAQSPAATDLAAGRKRSRSSKISTPALALAALAAVLALACLAWALARAFAYEPRWLLSLRHSLAEGGFRASATWSELTDWARLGR